MSAIYGVRYNCDNCGATADVWREDGKMPSVHANEPEGWKQAGYSNSGVKPLYQRPHVCPACVPILDAWEAEWRAWSERDGTVARDAYGKANEAVEARRKGDPRPPRVPPLARLATP